MKTVIVLDKLRFDSPYYTGLDGQPLFPADRFDVRLITTPRRMPRRPDPAVQSIVAIPDFEPAALAAAGAFQAGLDGTVCTALVALTERLLLPAAQMREQLGLSGDRVEDVLRFRDKVVMKEYLGTRGVRVPHFAPYSPDAARRLLDAFGKVVVKPRAEAGSKDVRFVDDEAGLAAFEAAFGQRTVDFEVEEWIDGELFHIDSVVEGSRVVVATAGRSVHPTTAYQTLSRFWDIEVAPGPLLDRLLAFNREVLACSPNFTGVTHHEVFVTADGIVFCEIAARFGGGGIRAGVYHRTGVDIARAMLCAQLGESMPRSTGFSDDLTGYTLVYVADREMRRELVVDEPWVLEQQVRTKPGDRPAAPQAWDRAVAILTVRGATEEEVAKRLLLCEEAVHRCFDEPSA